MQREIKISYLKKATKFLNKNPNTISENQVDELMILAIKKRVFSQENNLDIKMLKGLLVGKLRVRKGKIRIIFEIVENNIIIESIVEEIDFRGSIY